MRPNRHRRRTRHHRIGRPRENRRSKFVQSVPRTRSQTALEIGARCGCRTLLAERMGPTRARRAAGLGSARRAMREDIHIFARPRGPAPRYGTHRRAKKSWVQVLDCPGGGLTKAKPGTGLSVFLDPEMFFQSPRGEFSIVCILGQPTFAVHIFVLTRLQGLAKPLDRNTIGVGGPTQITIGTGRP